MRPPRPIRPALRAFSHTHSSSIAQAMPRPHLPQREERGEAEDKRADAKNGAARTRTRKDRNGPNGANTCPDPGEARSQADSCASAGDFKGDRASKKAFFWPAIRVLAQISGFFRSAADAQVKNPRSTNSSLETRLPNRARTRIAGQKTEICEHGTSNSPAKPKPERHPSPAYPFSFAPASLPRPPSGRTPRSRALTESELQPHP